MEDSEEAVTALASVLMAPPPLPRVDIVHIPIVDENSMKIAETEVYEGEEERRAQEKAPTTSYLLRRYHQWTSSWTHQKQTRMTGRLQRQTFARERKNAEPKRRLRQPAMLYHYPKAHEQPW